MIMKDDLKKNASGKADLTAYRAISQADAENERFYKLLHTIFYICNNAGFDVTGRISLTDRRTGRVWE